MTDEKPALPVDELIVKAVKEIKAEDPDHRDETDELETEAFLNNDYLP